MRNAAEQSWLMFPEASLAMWRFVVVVIVVAAVIAVFPQLPVALGHWDGQELLCPGSDRAWGGRAAGDAGGIPGFCLGAGSTSSQEQCWLVVPPLSCFQLASASSSPP